MSLIFVWCFNLRGQKVLQFISEKLKMAHGYLFNFIQHLVREHIIWAFIVAVWKGQIRYFVCRIIVTFHLWPGAMWYSVPWKIVQDPIHLIEIPFCRWEAGCGLWIIFDAIFSFSQKFVTATDIRIVLLRHNTFGDEIFQDSQVLKTYYYAISDLSVGGR